MPHWIQVLQVWFDLLYLYMGAVLQYWWAYMTAGPFIIDEGLKWISPRFREWFHTKVSGSVRRGAELLLMLGGVFVAGFLAFKAEHEKLEAITADLRKAETAVATAEEKLKAGPTDQRQLVTKLQDDIKKLESDKKARDATIAKWEQTDRETSERIATLEGQLELNSASKGAAPASWRPSETQKARLGELLDKSQQKFQVPFYCMNNDAQSKIVVADLWQVFELHNWHSYVVCSDFKEQKLTGINILVRNKEKLSEAPAAAHVLASLFASIGLRYSWSSYYQLNPGDFAVLVGTVQR